MNLTRYFVTHTNPDKSAIWLDALMSKRMPINKDEWSYVNSMDFLPQFQDNIEAKNYEDKLSTIMPPASSLLKDTHSSTLLLHVLPWGILRAIFVILDLLMLLFRCTCIYLHLRKVCLGSEEKLVLDAQEGEAVHTPLLSSEKQSYRINFQKELNDHAGPREKNSYDGKIVPQIELVTGNHQNNLSINSASPNSQSKYDTFEQTNLETFYNNVNVEFTSPLHSAKLKVIEEFSENSNYWTSTTKRCIQQFGRYGYLPKVLFVIVILFLVKLAQISIQTNFLSEFQMNFGGFFSATKVLQDEVDDMNNYLQAVATIHTNRLSRWQQKEMEKDLVHLQGIFEFFKRGTFLQWSSAACTHTHSMWTFTVVRGHAL